MNLFHSFTHRGRTWWEFWAKMPSGSPWFSFSRSALKILQQYRKVAKIGNKGFQCDRQSEKDSPPLSSSEYHHRPRPTLPSLNLERPSYRKNRAMIKKMHKLGIALQQGTENHWTISRLKNVFSHDSSPHVGPHPYSVVALTLLLHAWLGPQKDPSSPQVTLAIPSITSRHNRLQR